MRAACPAAQLAIHTDLGNHIQDKAGIAWVIEWYSNLAQQLKLLPAGTPLFDLIGLSLYPSYTDGKALANMKQLGALAKAFPQQRIYIAETAYPAAGSKQPEAQFPATPTGQLAYLKAARAALAEAVPASQFAGLLWWEGDEHGWNSLFDTDFVARPAMMHGFSGSSNIAVTA